MTTLSEAKMPSLKDKLEIIEKERLEKAKAAEEAKTVEVEAEAEAVVEVSKPRKKKKCITSKVLLY